MSVLPAGGSIPGSRLLGNGVLAWALAACWTWPSSQRCLGRTWCCIQRFGGRGPCSKTGGCRRVTRLVTAQAAGTRLAAVGFDDPLCPGLRRLPLVVDVRRNGVTLRRVRPCRPRPGSQPLLARGLWQEASVGEIMPTGTWSERQPAGSYRQLLRVNTACDTHARGHFTGKSLRETPRRKEWAQARGNEARCIRSGDRLCGLALPAPPADRRGWGWLPIG